MKTVQIHRNKVDAILRKHPWIFSGAITSNTDTFSDGEIVTVVDAKNNFLARGHFQHATIAVRVLTFVDLELNQAFFNDKISKAIQLRMSLNLITKRKYNLPLNTWRRRFFTWIDC